MARLRSRPPSDKESFNKRLQLYSLAASAAGVSLLAVGPPAEAKVVYTKADTAISPNSTVLLDLNNDGIADFKLTDTFHSSTTGGGGAFGSLFVAPAQQNNQVLGHTVPLRAYASALFANVEVGPKQEFLPSAGAMAVTATSGARPGPRFGIPSTCSAPWANVSARYLGFKFLISGEVHYGWARLTVSCSGTQVRGTVTGYAYETVAGRPIITGLEKGPDEGEPADRQNRTSTEQPVSVASLGLLAQGADGLRVWRQK